MTAVESMAGRAVAGPTRPRHFPYRAGDPRRMGVATIPERDWFEIDGDYAAQLAEKTQLLRSDRTAVFATLPEALPAAREIRDAVLRWAEASGAGFARAGDMLRRPDGAGVDLAASHPLETASLLVQEDLCVLEPDGAGALRLTAASLCFPSRWVLAEKIGHPMPAIHAPVPDLNDRLGGTIDRFLAGLKAGLIYGRQNWSLTTDPALFQPRALPHAPIAAAEAGARVFYRVERQTLRRLPETGAVLFGIRIHQHPLAALKAVPGEAHAFAAALAALDPALVAYKSMADINAAVIAYLEA